ncbi:oligopeptidase A [Alginatibacterium sediminis]|uniref:oligopeptidase A n=1 Tax=Alginatibacterium sediminis TaxID=2164068 RepID=A0A420E616_9ALTE|nr:oligopeptidase A [Alginatibacterium sediminis]RKF13178.1 oligopeptidase A [Alginatibacterium sediminis]
MSNPLLELPTLPAFSKIKVALIQPALEALLAECRAEVEAVLQHEQPSWENFIEPLDAVNDRLSRMWSPVSHMNSVVNSDELREVYESCIALLSEYSTEMGQHAGLYKAYLALEQSQAYSSYSTAQKKAIENALRDFKLSGIALDVNDQKRYGEISLRLSELASQFSNNVLDATKAWTKNITKLELLSGMPESALAAAAQAAKAKDLDGYLLSLEFPSYLPVMTYADDAKLREEMYSAFCTRASDQGPNAGEFDNSDIIAEQLLLRQEFATLLGFESFAHKSLATKMANSPDQVVGFLEDLAQRSLPGGRKDLEELQNFAKQEFGIEQLNAWDLAYYSEKLKQHKYAISDEELRPYFPEEKVVNGLFEVVQRLFSIRAVERDDVDTWHQDVRFFDLFDAQDKHRGSFYLDLYARENKRGGAWMDDCVGRRVLADGSVQLPVAYLTCNFNGPVGDAPALFTHDEVITLFHEFGHGLHHMLTQVDVSDVAGINGVAWDAVELPSQFLENWCWQPEALSFISGHFESGDPLPQEMLDKMLAAKNYQSAMGMLRQLEFSLFDFNLHLKTSDFDVPAVLAKVREQVSVLTPPSFNRFQHSFAHIFAGGYSAGYYSYKWAEVLSADAFSRFEQEGIFNQATGKDFLDNVLEQGGSKDAMQLFVGFMGREPQVDALLRHSGIYA